MRESKKPQRASFRIPGKYYHQVIVAMLQRQCPGGGSGGLESVCVHHRRGQGNREDQCGGGPIGIWQEPSKSQNSLG